MLSVGPAILALRVGRSFHEVSGFNAWGFVKKGLEITLLRDRDVASKRRRLDVLEYKYEHRTSAGFAEESFGKVLSP